MIFKEKISLKWIISIKSLLLLINVNAMALDSKLWYDKPAEKWETEALPIGNGRLGAMIFGGINTDKIQFNEQSLWSGNNNWDGEYETGDFGFGSYRNFGEFTVHFAINEQYSNYKRELDLINGIHTTSFTQNDIKYTREAFASYPDQIMVFVYKSSKNKSLTGKIEFKSAQGAENIFSDSRIVFNDEMPNKLKYAALLYVKNEGGKVFYDNQCIKFEKCNTLTIYLNARTNYKADYLSNWRGADPLPVLEKELKNIIGINTNILKQNHIHDFSSLMNRVSINVGQTEPKLLNLPINERLKLYASVKGTAKESKGHEVVGNALDDIKKTDKGTYDPELEQLIFQYGRYLLVSSSRKGGLPANLQGLWNESNEPAWASDYHTNINLQMNYWAAESCNLSECHLPLIDFIIAAQEPCRIATRKTFGNNMRGWTTRTSMNIFGGNGWEWNMPASAWLAQHLYEHWVFTQDTVFLIKYAYPVIKEICQFWEDNLKRLPDGSLVVPDGWSPEHGPREDGIMHDQQLIWDLFTNYVHIAKALNLDTDYQIKIKNMLSNLAPNKIGKWGQLQEWQTDRDDPDDIHRHTSHLFAVYPGKQISVINTPDFAEAARKSLLARSGNYGKNKNQPFTIELTTGDSRRSWTWPWRCALWARLGDGEKAGIMLRGLLTYNTLPNLFCNHPPFQLDGNFGIPAAIAEMLIQSHAGEIHLLPAIPTEWANKGSFKGLCARGGYQVDCEWKEGKVIHFAVYGLIKGKVNVRVNGKIEESDVKPLN